MEARNFGITALGLRNGPDFTRFVDTGGPVAYNLTAAERLRFRPRRWTFPLIGTVPYLGFFKKEDALREERRMAAQGYDTYLRPVAGYSSLGYFISPIYASMVEDEGPQGELRTVEVVLHEMAHSTAYIHSESELNESFATLVGVQGAALFFRQQGDVKRGDAVLQDAVEQERRAKAFSDWLQPVLTEVRAFYEGAQQRRLAPAELLRQREALFQTIMTRYRVAFPSGNRYRRLAQGPLNNAVLLAFGVYHRSSAIQQLLLDSVGGDLRAYINLYRHAQNRGDGGVWLKQLAGDYQARSRR